MKLSYVSIGKWTYIETKKNDESSNPSFKNIILCLNSADVHKKVNEKQGV